MELRVTDFLMVLLLIAFVAFLAAGPCIAGVAIFHHFGGWMLGAWLFWVIIACAAGGYDGS
jgi:hypothetical protein